MDARPIDPRDETWELRAPRYRAYFFEALAWAKRNRGGRTYALYPCAPINGMCLVRRRCSAAVPN